MTVATLFALALALQASPRHRRLGRGL